MISIVCCDTNCGVVFGLPDHIYEQARNRSDRWFKCPNGHNQHWEESNADRLKKRITELEETLTRWRAEVASADKRTAAAFRTIRYWKGIAHRRKS